MGHNLHFECHRVEISLHIWVLNRRVMKKHGACFSSGVSAVFGSTEVGVLIGISNQVRVGWAVREATL